MPRSAGRRNQMRRQRNGVSLARRGRGERRWAEGFVDWIHWLVLLRFMSITFRVETMMLTERERERERECIITVIGFFIHPTCAGFGPTATCGSGQFMHGWMDQFGRRERERERCAYWSINRFALSLLHLLLFSIVASAAYSSVQKSCQPDSPEL